MKELLVGCVGKPSAGKSTFFNAVVEQSSAKIGNYPFTTIEPNRGNAFYHTDCPCVKFGIECKPDEGSCDVGIRKIPVKLLDIAGLIPNAHAGEGLGNKFLDDIRQAHVLIHIVDISGTTDAKGEETAEYDPTGDHVWLMAEITQWIFGNLWGHWPSIVRKTASGATDGLRVLHEKLSGYNCLIGTVKTALSKCGYSGNVDFVLWTKDDVERFCRAFVEIRFPTILILNKSEKGFGAADVNIASITRKFPKVPVIMCSAKSELTLRDWSEKGFIKYDSRTGVVEKNSTLPKEFEDEFNAISDFVLLRCGSTGTQQAVQAACHLLNLQAVFPVDSLANIRAQKGPAFTRALLADGENTIKGIASIITRRDCSGVIAENVEGLRYTSDDIIDKVPSPKVVRISVGIKSIYEV